MAALSIFSRMVTLTTVAADVYNILLLNRLKPEIEKILGKIGTVFGEILPQPHRFLLSIETFNKYVEKISRQPYL